MSEKVVNINGSQHELNVERDGSRVRAGDLELEVRRLSDHEAEIRIGGRSWVVPYVIEGTRVSFSFDGEIYTADVTDKGARTRARHRDHSMSAPMPGLVLKILAKQGDVVTKGAPLIVLEAMKMEHLIVATHDGTVSAVNCREGEMVQPGVDLIEIA
jgi:3-methylcrotonyl-CoA carboxylase alpha subunit